jgi:hypothetical protein|tara:strand:+ start:241 stop:522 length:282 start_codon:yes stop_codon:yes gene_type:complete
MKNINKLILTGIVATIMASCTVTMPVAVSNAEIGDKRGVSESTVLFGVIYLNGNYGLKEAAVNGGISTAIATIDEETKDMIFFAKKKLIVTAK